MKLFLDTAHIPHIREAAEIGLCDGVTTNPTLLSKEEGEPREVVRQIAKLESDNVILSAESGIAETFAPKSPAHPIH